MKRRFCTFRLKLLLTLALSVIGVAYAQESYNMRYVTLDSIIRTLEIRTPDRFYYAPEQTDTLLITLQANAKEVLETLGRELRKSGFSLYRVYQHRWAIIKGTPVSGIHPAFIPIPWRTGNTTGKNYYNLQKTGNRLQIRKTAFIPWEIPNMPVLQEMSFLPGISVTT